MNQHIRCCHRSKQDYASRAQFALLGILPIMQSHLYRSRETEGMHPINQVRVHVTNLTA